METDEDIDNLEAWAVIIRHMLHRVSPSKRAEILALALKQEAAERAEFKRTGGLISFEASDLEQSPGLLHWHAIMRLKSLVVQAFARTIRNNHSPQRAAEILFVHHRYGTGSGDLEDYIGDLLTLPEQPQARRKVKRKENERAKEYR